MYEFNKITVLAAHSDDETIGCGGTIAKLTKIGKEVQLIIIADGVTSRDSANPQSLLIRNDASQQAAKILGIKKVINLKLEDNNLDRYSCLDIVKRIQPHINEFKPDTLFTHFSNDVNIDHRIVHECGLVISRPMPSQSIKRTFFFEVSSSTDWAFRGTQEQFAPSYFINISEEANIKYKALNCYTEEMNNPPHSRSVEGLRIRDKHRGFQIGVNFAEAFMIGRMLVD